MNSFRNAADGSSTPAVGMGGGGAQLLAGSGARLPPPLVGGETLNELLSLGASVSSSVKWSYCESLSHWIALQVTLVNVGEDLSTVWAHGGPMHVLAAVLICRVKCGCPSSFPILPACPALSQM